MHVPKAVSIVSLMALAALVAACHAPTSEDSVESLTNDPARLKVVLKQCKDAPESMPERTCRAAAEAFRQRFFAPGGGKTGNAATRRDATEPRP